MDQPSHSSHSPTNGDRHWEVSRIDRRDTAPTLAASDLFDMSMTQPPASDPSLSIASFMRWKGTIAAVFFMVFGALSLFIWTTMGPEYSSTAVMRVASVVPRVLYKTEDNGAVPLYQSYLTTQVSVVQSPEVLSRVFKHEDVRATGWYKAAKSSSGDDMAAMVDKLVAHLSVSERRGTELVDITMATSNSNEAATIVNAIAQEYKSFWEEQQAESERQRLATLHAQLSDVQEQIDKLFEAKYQLAAKLGTGLHDEVRTQMLEQINERRADLAKLRAEQAVRQFEMDKMKEYSKGRDDSSADDLSEEVDYPSMPMFESNPTWVQQRENLEQAKHRLAQLRTSFGDAHPKAQAAIADVKYAQRMLRMTEQRMNPTHMEYNIGLQEQKEKALQESMQELMRQMASGDSLANELARTEESYNDKKTVRKDLLERLRALEMESNAPGRVVVQSAGLVRRLPSSDRRTIFTLCAFLTAIMGGLGAGYLRSRIDPTIHAFGDMATSSIRDVPFLGQLPRCRNALQAQEHTLTGLSIKEHIRLIRTMLLQRLGNKGASVVVTSPEPSTGKTTVSILLGQSLAHIGKKVLLVDLDFPHPSLSEHFGLLNQPGLRSTLTGNIDECSAIVASDTKGLDILPVGRREGVENYEILANGAFSASIERWTKMYDFVLMDSPPVLSMADARIAAGHADGSIMVLRASHSRRQETVEALASLSTAGGTLLGTILCGVDTNASYYPDYYAEHRANTAELLA